MASSSSASAELSTEVSTPMASDTANLSPEDLNQLFIDVITTANERRLGAVGNQFVTMDQLKDLIETTLDKLIQAKADPAAEDKKEDKETEDDKTKSSHELPPTSEIKIVNEIWDRDTWDFKLVDGSSTVKTDELPPFGFQVRKRVDRENVVTTFIDLKSPGLRDILRDVFKDIRSVDLGSQTPTIKADVLYHFLPELKELSQNGLSAEDSKEHFFNLGKICQYLEQAYKVTTDRVESVIRGRYISYDLLWAFFKPESLLYCSCPATDLPRCIRYIEGYTQRPNYHEDKEFFKIRASFLNFDGGSVREILKTYEIEKFNGRKRLEDLPIYPLHYCPDQGIKKFLISRGQKFISIAGRRCHRRYSGNIFFEPEDPNEIKLAKRFVDGRIMVDSAAFRKMVPRYRRLRSESPASYSIFRSSGGDGLAKIAGPDCLDPKDLQDEDFLICSPTVLGFALDGKIWGELSVSEVEEIEFSTSSFGKVLIPEKQKDVILSLTASHLVSTSDKGFGDIIDGKGRGIIILLHGPPGVGKTVTAEALADHLRRPLYSVSAGNMGEKAEEFEAELTRMFRIASDWESILLIDEADTFLQRRDQNPQHNRIVATFLRTLEYFDGILFLTTNFVNNFDKAILDRVHLKVRYEGLDPSKRKDIFTHFLQLINATVEDADLTRFCEVRLNGRQIRNIVRVAHSLASHQGSRTSAAHIQLALESNGHYVRA